MNLHIAKLQKCYDVVNDNIENICVGLLDPIAFWDSTSSKPSTKATGYFPRVSLPTGSMLRVEVLAGVVVSTRVKSNASSPWDFSSIPVLSYLTIGVTRVSISASD